MSKIDAKLDLLIQKFDHLIKVLHLNDTQTTNLTLDDQKDKFKIIKPPREMYFTGTWQPTAVSVNGLFLILLINSSTLL